VHEVPVTPRSADGFDGVVSSGAFDRYRELASRVTERLTGRTLWHVNSTAEGGGVAELLSSMLGYLASDGIRARWLVVDGDADFFDITKRIHNRLHGSVGDGGGLEGRERLRYEEILGENFAQARSLFEPGDVTFLHDPQTLGLAPALSRMGIQVIWVCHVGVDSPNSIARSAWQFFVDDLRAASAIVFSRKAYKWDGIPDERVAIVPPCIDAFSLKNVSMEAKRRDSILHAAGVIDGAAGTVPEFARPDGSTGRIVHRAEMIEDAGTPVGAPLVVQVSRWDRLKDPEGVVRGFAEATDESGGVHLILAGPGAASVADDPESVEVLAEVNTARDTLSAADRARIHLANLPTQDHQENAVIVNALQRRADVVVQKSLAEGFGLTVAEAMWKERPVVGSRVGGIQDQIVDGQSGLLVDPTDLGAFGEALRDLLADSRMAADLGAAAHERVRSRFLSPQYLSGLLGVVDDVIHASGFRLSSP
jgi:trehalose synthase